MRFAVDRYAVPAKGLDEGVEAYVEYTGKLEAVVSKMADGLRAAFGYAGATSVRSMWDRARFGLITPIGAGELGAHSLAKVKRGKRQFAC